MGGSIACVDCACVLLVAQTRLRRFVAGGGDFVLRCFVGGADDCGGGCDGKEVDMEVLFCVGFFSFLVGIIIGASVAGIVANSINDKILESSNELCDSCGNSLVSAMDKMYEYGQKVKELEEKQVKEYFDSHKGGVVPPNKHREDFITRSETVVDINKLKEEFEK